MNKKQFFKKKAQEVTYSIWDAEFKIHKSREIREACRLDRDWAMDHLAQAEAILKNPEITEEQKAKAEEDIKVHKANAENYERQMDMVDKQIAGFAGRQNADGDWIEAPVVGVMEQLKSLTELREMYKSYAKKA